MKKNPLVTIILLNFNGAKFASLWSSFFRLDYPNYEIVFIDNGSTDKSLELFLELTKIHPHIPVKVVKLDKNVGYSKANNLGIKYARGEYIVLVSNDVEVESKWLTNMISVLESDHSIGVAQCMMYSLYHRDRPDFMWNYLDVVGFNHEFQPSKEIKEVFYSEGAVMFIRANLIQQVGGLFDDDYFMLFEDVDFCWRIRLRGYKIVVVPTSIAYHARGGTVAGVVMKRNPLYMYTNVRNRLSTLFKNYECFNLIKYLPLSILLELGISCLLSLKGKPKLGVACFRGVFSFLFNLRALRRKRAYVQSMRKVSDMPILQILIPLAKGLRSSVRYISMINRES